MIKKILNRRETKYLVIVDFKYMMEQIDSSKFEIVSYDETLRIFIMKNIYYGVFYHFNTVTNEKIIYFPAYGPYCAKEMFSFIVPCHWQETLYKLPGEPKELYYKVSYSEFV